MQPSLQTLYGYWNEVRAGRIAPQRLEIEPSRIAGILSETFMLERIDAGTYQFRLAGTRLCELFGSELRGKNFLDGWSEQDRRVLERHLATISEQGAAALLTIEGVIDTRHRVELEANLLPLLHARQDHPHHRRHERHLGTPLARQRAPAQPPPQAPSDSSGPTDGRTRSSARLGRQAPFQPALTGPGVRIVKTEQRRFRVLEGGPHRRQARQALARDGQVDGSRRLWPVARGPHDSAAGACRLARNGPSVRASLNQIPR